MQDSNFVAMPTTAAVRMPTSQVSKSAATGAAEAARRSLTREIWIAAATEVLVDRGIEHVRIDVLARQLTVTRGSFYWHFRDRDDLLGSVLRVWHESATQQLTLRLGQAHADVREQLRGVLSLPARGRAAVRAARIELAIRAWARRDLMARHAVDEADASRMAYIAQLFSALGFSVVEARSRAFLLYSYNIGESLMAGQGNAAQRADRCRAIERLLTEGALR